MSNLKKMKKKIDFIKRVSVVFLFCVALFNLSGCIDISEPIKKMFGDSSSDEDALKSKELELRERELALKEKQGQQQGQGQGTGQERNETISSTENLNNTNFQVSPFGNARVTGSAVQLRQDHTTTAQSLKSMKKNELLQILEEFVPNGNAGEAILTAKTDFFDEYNGSFSFSLPKGKAVFVEGRVEGDKFNISYLDVKTKRKGFAKISQNLLEFISGKPWYLVKREDGQTGWVYSEFVERL
jgi:hypothetical protein